MGRLAFGLRVGQQVRETATPKKLLLLVGSLVFMLFLAESTLRLFPLLRPLPRTYVGEYDNRQAKHARWAVPDPLLGWKLPPNPNPNASPINVRTNAQGFRALSDFRPNQACKEIAFVGGSFTYGVLVGYEK